MGHRELLLQGAKKCLSERGYAGTTARDIVAASGTNLASIGYHFGSKDALLTEAMVEALGEWGDEVERVLLEAQQADVLGRLEAMWTGLLESFEAQRGLWIASFEIGTMAERNPELKRRLAEANEMARVGLASILLGTTEIDESTARTVGAVLAAMIPGIFSQWLVDPGRMSTGADLATGFKRIAALL